MLAELAPFNVITIMEKLFGLSAGDSAPCVMASARPLLWSGVVRLADAIRAAPERVRGVVVVGVAGGVDIPRIIRVAAIR